MLGSDAFFRRLVESSTDGVWAFDDAGRTLYVNQRMADLLGYPLDELRAMSRMDAHDERGRREFLEHLAHVRADGPNAGDVECMYVRKDGSYVPLMIGETVLRDDDGTLLCYVHRVTDDRQRRELMTELSSSRRQLDEAQAIARLGSWDLDLHSQELTVSQQMYRLLGLDPDVEVCPADFWTRLVPGDRDVALRAMREAQRTRTDFTFDVRLKRDSGAPVWLRGLGRHVLDASGRAVRVSGTLQEVTEIKEAELQLLDAVVLNALMQVMATAANEAQSLDEALEVVRAHLLAHDDWTRAVGFHVESGRLTGPHLGPEHDPERLPTTHERDVAARALRSAEPVFDEETHPDAPSVAFTIEAAGEPLLAVVCTAASPFERHDMLASMMAQVARQLGTVAERERATTALAEARDAAMQASLLKSAFLATMSHEIRTPMNGVIGLNDLLLRSDLDDYQRRLAVGMQTAGRSLLGVINDILDFSKIEAGQLELEATDFRLDDVLQQTVTILAGVAVDKGLEVGTHVDPDVPPVLVGDPVRLGQVLSNLVSNAVKFTPSGRIEVRAARAGAPGLEHGPVGDDVLLRIEVADTGVGIAPEAAEHLFEPFRQADASTTRTFGGTGLGLAICHQLVAAMGGEIGVDSEVGRGSTFWFTVRLRRAETAGPADESGPAPEVGGHTVAGRGRVLVVEDNDINQLVALGLLEALGYSAVVVDNGADALVAAAAQEYDAVLMDIQMPGMDGYTAARRLREDEAAAGRRRTPIVAMTASAMQGERERCLAAGMDDYVSKPVASHRLEAVLGGLLGGAGAGAGASAGAGSDREPAPAPAVVSAVLDVGRLEELDALGEGAATLVTRAITNFIARAPDSLEDLAAAQSRDDLAEVMALAHRLKGSAWNLGAVRVGMLCERLELEARAGRLVGADEQLQELRAAYVDAADALRSYRGLDEVSAALAR